MAGGDFILAGLMQGLGKGQEMTYLQNRELALENLRNQRQIDAEGRQENRAISAETRKDARDQVNAERDQGYKLEQLGVSGEETRRTNEQKFRQEVQIVGIKANEDRKTEGFKAKLDENLARIRADLDRRNDAASQQLKSQLDQQDDPVTDQITDANGRVILITKRGRGIVTPYTEREQVDTSAPYGRKERKRGPTPGNFDPNDSGKSAAPSNSNDGSPWYSPGAKPAAGSLVATKAQVAEAAKAKGWTEAQTRRWMQQNGWSIE